jgi:hypothetical protein
MNSPYDIIRKMITAIILRQYPQIESIGYIDSNNLGGVRMYSVGLIMNEHIEPPVQMEINKEIKKLFRMASLDVKSKTGFKNDFINTYFDFKDGEGYRIESFMDDVRYLDN